MDFSYSNLSFLFLWCFGQTFSSCTRLLFFLSAQLILSSTEKWFLARSLTTKVGCHAFDSQGVSGWVFHTSFWGNVSITRLCTSLRWTMDFIIRFIFITTVQSLKAGSGQIRISCIKNKYLLQDYHIRSQWRSSIKTKGKISVPFELII
jgi:hypothetical protein